MTVEEAIDLLERAHEYGCFPEVAKLIKGGSDRKLIEVVLDRAKERMDKYPFNWDDFFGGD